jgi:hypothetical protein
MSETKQLRETRRLELVETHNLALSFSRLNPNGWDSIVWRRALYHAISMSECCPSREMQVAIREALKLP